MQRLTTLYTNTFGHAPQEVTKLPGAGSNRLYYRMVNAEGQTVIGVVGTSQEENRSFYEMTLAFTQRELNVPKAIARTDDYMAYIIEDLGSTSLFDGIKAGRESGGQYSEQEEALIAKAISALPRFQHEGASADVFAYSYPQQAMDRTSVMFDLNYFKYDFLKLTGIDFNEYKLQADFESLADRLLSEPADTFLYRDFQARNVMMRGDEPYFIDYQGGRRGPIYYDVASFLWQASSLFSDELRSKMIDVYLAALQPYQAINRDQFINNLRPFILFRLLQVLGAYGFRGLWEKKPHFINSIPPALESLKREIERGACDDYPYLKEVLAPLNPPSWGEGMLPSSMGTSVVGNFSSPHEGGQRGALGIRVYSFSYKKGIPTDASGNGGGYVFDCRSSNNPGRYDEYKPLTGLDKPVIDFLEQDGEIVDFLNKIYPIADFHVQRWLERGFTDLMFCFGCTGGRHRSVYSAQHLAEHIHQRFGVDVYLCHREQGIETLLTDK